MKSQGAVAVLSLAPFPLGDKIHACAEKTSPKEATLENVKAEQWHL